MMDRQTHFFALQDEAQPGRKIAYSAWESDVALRPLLCVHGLTRNARDFDCLAQSMATTRRVICPDVAGRGDSQRLNDPMRYHYGTYVMDMLALMDGLGITQCDWVGTSMGGIIGMLVAAQQPSRLRKLVINDIGALLSKEGLRRIIDYVGVGTNFSTRETAEAYLRTILASWGLKEAKHWEHLLQHSIEQTGEGFALRYDPAIRQKLLADTEHGTKIEDINLWPVWEQITCPVLLLRGTQSDLLSHDVAVRMRDSRAGVALVEWEGVGHAPALMDAAQIDIVQQWLQAS